MPVRLCVGDPILVYLSKEDKTQGIGLIKYIGFIEGYDMTEYVGIELLEQLENGHDGVINGFQYFTARKKHGIHVRISNIIRKLNATEITIKMQEVISMFKQKLEQYINAVSQRDDYIESLKQAHHDAKNLVKQARDKIMSLKKEINELRTRYRNAQNAKTNNHSPSNSRSIGDMANIICIEDADNLDDIDRVQSNEQPSKPRRGRHGRNLSAQLNSKLDTIDDTYALMTPVADIPLLIDQLVQNMDSRRQSFNTARAASPITPMTPATPSIDSVTQDIDQDTPASVMHHPTPMLDDFDRVDETPSTIQTRTYKPKHKGRIYDRSFPDTETPMTRKQRSHRRVASDTTSDRYPFSPETDQSPSPGPKIHLQRPKHLHSLSMNSAGGQLPNMIATPDTEYDETETPETEYDNCETEYEDESEDESEEQAPLTLGDNTPYWSSSGDESDASDTEESEEETATANGVMLTTPKPETPAQYHKSKKHKHRSKKAHRRKDRPRQIRQSSVGSPRENDGKPKRKGAQQQLYYNDSFTTRAQAAVRGAPPGARHHHQGSAPVINLQTHKMKVPQSMNQPPPQHGSKQHDQQNVAYYAMVPQIQPQLDNWMQINNKQPPPQQRHRKQHKQQSVQQTNPYLDQQYLPQFQNNPYPQQIQPQQQRPIQIYTQQQQQQQQQPHRGQLPPGHRTFYSDSLNYAQFQAQQQQQQQHANRKMHKKSNKVYVAPRTGRRSYKVKGDKNIQMFAAPKGNNGGNMPYYE
eukprot:268168_1